MLINLIWKFRRGRWFSSNTMQPGLSRKKSFSHDKSFSFFLQRVRVRLSKWKGPGNPDFKSDSAEVLDVRSLRKHFVSRGRMAQAGSLPDVAERLDNDQMQLLNENKTGKNK